MATPMLRSQFAELTNLEVALRTVMFDQMAAVADEGAPLFGLYNIQASTDASETTLGMGGFGNVKEYDGSIQYDSIEKLYARTYTHKELVSGFMIQQTLIEDEKYNQMNQMAQRFALSYARTRYVDAASLFNNAFSSSYTGGDSKALCATDHPYSPTNASTQSNKGTTALSYDAVIATELLMMALKDSRGNPMAVMPDTLIVPVALKSTAETIVGSSAKPGTANNDANTASGYRVVVSRYLTDTNNWFLADSMLARSYLNWFDRILPDFAMDPTSDFNLGLKMRGRMRYSFGWDHWAWLYGHEVA